MCLDASVDIIGKSVFLTRRKMSWSFFSSRYLLTVSSFLFSIISLFFFSSRKLVSFFSSPRLDHSQRIFALICLIFYLHDILLFLANATNWVNTKSHRLIRPITFIFLITFLENIPRYLQAFLIVSTHIGVWSEQIFPASFRKTKRS